MQTGPGMARPVDVRHEGEPWEGKAGRSRRAGVLWTVMTLARRKKEGGNKEEDGRIKTRSARGGSGHREDKFKSGLLNADVIFVLL